MSLSTNTRGGTNAGWRNPFEGRAMPWQCECVIDPNDAGGGVRFDTALPPYRKTNLGALRRCPDCGTERPS